MSFGDFFSPGSATDQDPSMQLVEKRDYRRKISRQNETCNFMATVVNISSDANNKQKVIYVFVMESTVQLG